LKLLIYAPELFGRNSFVPTNVAVAAHVAPISISSIQGGGTAPHHDRRRIAGRPAMCRHEDLIGAGAQAQGLQLIWAERRPAEVEHRIRHMMRASARVRTMISCQGLGLASACPVNGLNILIGTLSVCSGRGGGLSSVTRLSTLSSPPPPWPVRAAAT